MSLWPPKFTTGFSTLATIDVAVPESADGVLFCVGGIAGGCTAYLDRGHLKEVRRLDEVA